MKSDLTTSVILNRRTVCLACRNNFGPVVATVRKGVVPTVRPMTNYLARFSPRRLFDTVNKQLNKYSPNSSTVPIWDHLLDIRSWRIQNPSNIK